MTEPFRDRKAAGKQLAEACSTLLGAASPAILGIPRGGVVIGYQLWLALSGDLDVIMPRKIGTPNHPELALGAVTERGSVLLDKELMRRWGIPESYVKAEAARQQREVQRRSQLYRQGRRMPSLQDRVVIVADDGIATGFTMQAALMGVREERPRRLIMAVPVAPAEALARLKPLVDDLICLATPSPFYAVGQWYRDFEQVTDEEVLELLTQANS